MGYIYGPKKNESYAFTVRLLTVADGEFAINPTIVAGDWQRSINGGALAPLETTPTVSPAGSSQIVVTLGPGELPGPFTTIQFMDLTVPREFHDNAWEIQPTVVGAGSGAVITVNPSAFIDAEAVANLVGPYIANLLINSLNLPTEGEWDQILAQSALIAAIKAKTDLLEFTSDALQVIVNGFTTGGGDDMRDLLYATWTDAGKTLAELPAVVPANPTMAQAIMWLVQVSRNGGVQSRDLRTVQDSNGVQIASQVILHPGTVIEGLPFTS